MVFRSPKGPGASVTIWQGLGGFHGGSSIARLLEKHRGKRNPANLKESDKRSRDQTENDALDTGKALHVLLKRSIQLQTKTTTFLFLEQAQVRTVGKDSYVTGRSIEHDSQVWIPFSEVAAMEEFMDLAEMGKIYSLPRSVER